MSADRYEILDDGALTIAIKLGENTQYVDELEDDFVVGAIRQQARDLDQLRIDLAAAVAKRDEWASGAARLSSQLGNLLAVIHRDGGHYESEHGTEKACADAELAVHVQRGIADRYHDALKIWRQRAEQAEARLAALAELERAAADLAISLDFYKKRCDALQSWQSKMRDPERTIVCDILANGFTLDPPGDRYTPAPVAEIRDVVVTDEMCDRAYIGKWRGVPELIGHEPDDEDRQWSREWLEAWRTELGPALGMVELKEPTPEECERICTEYERLLMREGTCGGRDAFDAVRAVMWPKEGL